MHAIPTTASCCTASYQTEFSAVFRGLCVLLHPDIQAGSGYIPLLLNLLVAMNGSQIVARLHLMTALYGQDVLQVDYSCACSSCAFLRLCDSRIHLRLHRFQHHLDVGAERAILDPPRLRKPPAALPHNGIDLAQFRTI